MCFAIRIAIEGLAYGEREGKPYAMCLCDTVCVANSYDNMVVTSAVEKSFKRISLHTAEDGLETNPNS
jgi:alpha-D-ribose 1-methylphosphonate 5-triphosphate synthase subunit PhnI